MDLLETGKKNPPIGDCVDQEGKKLEHEYPILNIKN